MPTRLLIHWRLPLLPAILCAAFLLVAACGSQTRPIEKNDQAARLAGTWSLDSRITDGAAVPVSQRLMKLELNPDGTFHARYRGNRSQSWIRAGQGGFSYEPPYLMLYWDSGAVATLLVTEPDPDRLVVHHGRNLVPLQDQEPDEIFVRERIERGPTRSPSS